MVASPRGGRRRLLNEALWAENGYGSFMNVAQDTGCCLFSIAVDLGKANVTAL
jgi:hypothetical protein